MITVGKTTFTSLPTVGKEAEAYESQYGSHLVARFLQACQSFGPEVAALAPVLSQSNSDH